MASAFGPGRDPGDPGSNPTWGSRCMEPASPSACLSLPLSLCDYHKIKKIIIIQGKSNERIKQCSHGVRETARLCGTLEFTTSKPLSPLSLKEVGEVKVTGAGKDCRKRSSAL